jgi:hypothetical protein
MGLFLCLSGIIGVSEDAVVSCLKDYAVQKNGDCYPDDGKTEFPDVLVVGSNKDRITVVYPGDFLEWDDASRHLSEFLSRPVFSFHIHDGDMWMFTFFCKGEIITQYNPTPEYWGEISDEEKEQWKGDVSLIASCIPNLKTADIKNYLKQWDMEKDEGIKAYPDDEFPYLDCWQLCDFMKRIDLVYPMKEDGTVVGHTYRFTVSQPKQIAEKRDYQKPWWKFW